MEQYIKKSALVAEIKRLLAFYSKEIEDNKEDPWAMDIAKRDILQEILSFLDTLEVEVGNGNIKALITKDYNSIDPHFAKPIDNVEPKFHEGDLITDGYLHYKITDVLEDRYIVDTKYVKRSAILFDNESRYHLWTIQDAKDGDVLVCKGNIKDSNGIKYERICLFNNLDHAFFTLTKLSNFVEEYDIDVNIDYPDNTVPATKEQKEILFIVMKNAGYEWSDKDRKLIKIVK